VNRVRNCLDCAALGLEASDVTARMRLRTPCAWGYCSTHKQPRRSNFTCNRVIAAQGRDPEGGVIVMPDVSNDVNRELIIALAARYRVRTIYFNRFFSELGGLISYGDVRSEQFRLAAGYIDRILKGEKPADLPVQVPTKFELIINLRTAKALGLKIPESFLVRADEVIE
jgi:putative ABC transport system substrate-binding protein